MHLMPPRGQKTDGRCRVVPADHREQGNEPVRLHNHMPQTVLERVGTESLGSQVWSKPFEQLIGPIVPMQVIEARGETHWRDWWSDEYVMSRLATHFESLVLEVVLEVVRNREFPQIVARRFRRPEGWILRQVREVVGFVRRHYLPYTRPKPNVRSARAERRQALATHRGL